MTPEPDFPAAHSMDSTWFAVDAAGHVSSCVTGEDGDLPVVEKSVFESLDQLLAALWSELAPAVRANAPVWQARWPLERDWHQKLDWERASHAPLLFAALLDPTVDAGIGVRAGELVIFSPLASGVVELRQRLEQLHAQGACRGCQGIDDTEEALGVAGGYHYAAYDAREYHRESVPLAVAAVVAKRDGLAKLPFAFAATETFKPILLMRCFRYAESCEGGPFTEEELG